MAARAQNVLWRQTTDRFERLGTWHTEYLSAWSMFENGAVNCCSDYVDINNICPEFSLTDSLPSLPLQLVSLAATPSPLQPETLHLAARNSRSSSSA